VKIASKIQKGLSNYVVRYISAITAALITSLFAALHYHNMVKFVEISPAILSAVFTVILGTIATSFSILMITSEIISAASDLDMKSEIRKIFFYPLRAASLGLVLSITALTFNFPILQEFNFLNLDKLQIFRYILFFLLIYGILATYNAISFVIRASIEMED
jgi:hypothetical protein